MPNTIQIQSVVLAEVAAVLHEKAFMMNRASKNLSKNITRNSGNSITVPKPSRPVVGTTADMTSTGRTMVEGSTTLTTVRRNAAVDLTSAERTWALGDKELFRSRVIEPIASRLAREINIVGLSTLGQAGGHVVGRADYTKGLSYSEAAKLNAALGRGLAPTEDRCVALSTDDWAEASALMAGYFNPQKTLSDSLAAGGVQGDIAGMMWYPTQSLPAFQIASSDAAGAVNDTVAEGDAEITINSIQSSGTIYAGQSFTIAGVNEIDPETQLSNGKPKAFVVKANATISGNAATVTVCEAMYTTATNRTVANMSALPANGAVVTFTEGAITKTGNRILAWHPDALLFASVDLYKPNGNGAQGESISLDGLNMRIVNYGDGITDVYGTRIDLEFGFANVYPELVASTAGLLI